MANTVQMDYNSEIVEESEPTSSGIQNLERDDKYWERRRKNNLAAKKSRDARKIRENQLKCKVACLENANQVLRTKLDSEVRKNRDLNVQIDEIKKENESLKCQLGQKD